MTRDSHDLRYSDCLSSQENSPQENRPRPGIVLMYEANNICNENSNARDYILLFNYYLNVNETQTDFRVMSIFFSIHINRL